MTDVAGALGIDEVEELMAVVVGHLDAVERKPGVFLEALLQKTYVADCISKKCKKNNGELPMYYVENNHPAIIERSMFDRVQEEISRRNSKQKVKEKGAKTELGKY